MKIPPLFLCVLLVALPSALLASGYHIPNQSVGAMGIAGAHVAYTPGPDSSYFNPANMSFLSDRWQLEASLTAIYAEPINYSDNRSPLLDGSSESELFFLPQLHVASRDLNDFRLGFSLTYPYGLAKRWKDPYQAATAETYELLVIEGNPTFSYSISDKVSIGGGVRIIYGNGEVRNSLSDSTLLSISPLSSLSSAVDGDDLQVGYNLALTVRPVTQVNLSATYRSEVDLDLEGDASLRALAGSTALIDYSGSGRLELPLPAVLSLAGSYTVQDFTFEITWNRTFWSALEQLDFQFDQSFVGTPFDSVDRAIVKNWEDADALRLGLTYEASELLEATFGFAYDNNPVPEYTLGFELPDSDTYMYSVGLRYRHSDTITAALSYCYQYYTSRSATNNRFDAIPGIDGVFKDGDAHGISIGIIYTF